MKKITTLLLFLSLAATTYCQQDQSLTSDTGTKVASFKGATQTNSFYSGANVTVVMGHATADTLKPSMSIQLQFSPDAGTTWLSLGDTTVNVTDSANTILLQIYPTHWERSTTTVGQLITGATYTLQLDAALPKTWRIAYTVRGKNPSFKIVGVYVNYLI